MINPIRRFGARRIVTAVLALGLVGVVAVPAIDAASAAAAPASAAGAANPGSAAAGAAGATGQIDEAALTPAAVRLGARLLNRVVRGDLVVRAKGGTYVSVHYERGRITAVSATSISVVGPDGKGATFTVTSTTRVRSAGALVKITDLTVGQNAIIFGTGSAGSYNAVLIRGLVARPAANPAPTTSSAP